MLGTDIAGIKAESLFSKSQLDKILKKIFGGSEEIPKEIFNATYEKLSAGVNLGYGTIKDATDAKMVFDLKSNVAVFSAFKANHYGATMRDLLVDSDNKKRSWSEFRKEAIIIDPKYNQVWLNAEYNLAIRQARAAENWQNFVRDKDSYPNLEYMPSRSADPRDAHTQYYGIIKPIDDAFWNTAMPPNGWGCKCWVQQTRNEETGKNIEAPIPIPGIDGNAGKSGHIFSPSHPFVTAVAKGDKEAFLKEFKEIKSYLKENIQFPVGKNKISISINAHDGDLMENLNFITPFVKKYKEDYAIRPHFENGNKNPEYQKGKTTGDLTTWKKAKSIESYVDGNFKLKYQRQMKKFNSVFVGFDFDGQLTKKNYLSMWSVLNGKINSKRLEYVLLKNGNKTLKITKGTTYKEGMVLISKELL